MTSDHCFGTIGLFSFQNQEKMKKRKAFLKHLLMNKTKHVPAQF